MADLPVTPPDTPDPEKGKGRDLGPGKIEGNVNYEGANITGAITTGHVHAYEVVLTTINVTVESATDVTKKIQEFMTEIDLQLDTLSDKIGATAHMLDLVITLVVKRAKRAGIQVDRDIKVPALITGQAIEEGVAQRVTPKDLEEADEVLNLTAFKHIMEAGEGARRLFGHIKERIQKAKETIPKLTKLQAVQEGPSGTIRGGHPQHQNTAPPSQDAKAQLSDENKRILLSREEVVRMEKDVDARKLELWMRVTAFDYSLNDKLQEKQEHELQSAKKIIKEAWKELKKLADFLLNNRPHSHVPANDPLPLLDSNSRIQHPRPDPARLVSVYMGWTFRKSPPPHLAGQTSPHKPSWKFAVPIRIPFSTEELFLRVLAQVTQRAKSDRTLADEHVSVLRKRSQRGLVANLLAWQNGHLQRDFPQLEWTVAGLELSTSPLDVIARAWSGNAAQGKRRTKSAAAAFEVILKTQWRLPPTFLPPPPPPPPSGLRGIDISVPAGMNLFAPSPPVQIPGGRVHSRLHFPPGFGVPHDRASSQPLGIHIQGGQDRGTGIPIITNDGYGGPSDHQVPVPVIQSKQSKRRKHKSAPLIIREPELVLVEEGGKKSKKGKRKDIKNNKNSKSKKKVYVELRQPGIYNKARHYASGQDHPPYPASYPAPHPRPLPTPAHRQPFPSASFSHSEWSHHPHPPPPAGPSQYQYKFHTSRPPEAATTSYQQEEEEEEEEEEESEQVVEELLDEFSEATTVPLEPTTAAGTESRRRSSHHRPSLSRSLMQQLEEASSRRISTETETMRIRLNSMSMKPPGIRVHETRDTTPAYTKPTATVRVERQQQQQQQQPRQQEQDFLRRERYDRGLNREYVHQQSSAGPSTFAHGTMSGGPSQSTRRRRVETEYGPSRLEVDYGAEKRTKRQTK
ncbi:hypothetical protein QBC44DRAFT_384061 [Cladorrhinum sp. PSN332]|nr:hypothetical protein QBC44DRAFT_384061 [Cladorrhinum sp. PSN332]